MHGSRVLVTALATVLMLLLAGCSQDWRSSPAALPPQEGGPAAPVARARAFETYVALGDSFTAGPFVPTTDLAGGCFRSDGNYPALLAEMLAVEKLVDVSCSGASTRDLVAPQRTVQEAQVPPQLDAVHEHTDLVTLGIGGNDFGLFSTLVRTCTEIGSEKGTGTPCFDTLEKQGVDLVAKTARIGERVAASVRRVQERAPSATVVLVGYSRLAPRTGTCQPLPFVAGDARLGDRVTRALNDALEDAARRTGVLFADMYAASEGHDICSDEPWVNGRWTDRQAALAYHPFASGMRATAEEIADRLEGRALAAGSGHWRPSQ